MKIEGSERTCGMSVMEKEFQLNWAQECLVSCGGVNREGLPRSRISNEKLAWGFKTCNHGASEEVVPKLK